MERPTALAGVVLLGATLLCFLPGAARADERGPDPQIAYSYVRVAYAKERIHAHGIINEQNYYSAIISAGRGFARMRPNSPEFGKLAVLTVQIGERLHYNPLISHDAAPWWIREAAVWVTKNSKDLKLIHAAGDLIGRVDAMSGDPEELARLADTDAGKILHEYPHDRDAMRLAVEADWRAWLLTNNRQWRDKAYAYAATAGIANDAIPTEIAIAPVADMSLLAPADEYFGRFGYSILGIRNALRNVNAKIDDANSGSDQESIAMLVTDSVCDMQKAYPQDRDLPKLLYDDYTLLGRIGTPNANAAAARLRTIITVEYQGSNVAQELLTNR